jgi:large subunit ribosomal protein L7/L12
MAEGNGVAFSGDITELGDKIAALTVAKAVELGNYLEQKYGIKPAAGGAVMVPGPSQAAAAEPPKEQTEFTVVLEGVPDTTKKISVIKVVRELTNLGLKEAKDLVDGAPKEIKAGVSKDDAETIKKKIAEAGGAVEIK